MFGAWGRLVYRLRWFVLVLSLALVALSVVAIVRLNTALITGDSGVPGTESSRAASLIAAQLPSDSGGSFTLIFTAKDPALKATDPAFAAAVEAAVAPLRGDQRVMAITQNPAFVSKDGQRAFVTIATRDRAGEAGKYYEELRAQVRSDRLDILATGNLPINADFTTVTEHDLRRAEFIGLPIALGILLLVFGATLWRTMRRTSVRGAALVLALTFGSLLIALVPLLVGGFAILGGLAGIYAIAQSREMSIYSLNIASMIGLGLAIDYSLFIISRFLEEVERRPVGEAIARTIATTGKAITFSGLTVAIGVAGLLFYRSPLLNSIGLSAMLVVGTAVLYGLTFLPALLSIVGDAIARRAARRGLVTAQSGAAHTTAHASGPWHALAMGVMARPWAVLLPLLVVLLLAGSPILNLRLGSADITVLPPEVESRRAYDILVNEFPGSEYTNIPVVVNYASGQPLTAERIGQLYDYANWLGTQRDVARVQSVVVVAGPDGKPLPKEQAIALLSAPPSAQPAALQEGIRRTVGQHIVTLTVQTPLAANSDEAHDLVRGDSWRGWSVAGR